MQRYRPAFARERLGGPQPTPGQRLIDVLHYELDIAFNQAQGLVEGSVRAVVRGAADTAFCIVFDAHSCLTISSVTKIGFPEGPLTYSHGFGRLTIDVPHGLLEGEEIEIEIVYNGHPAWASWPGVFFVMPGGIDGFYSLNEPWSANTWFPCKDHPCDKATFDIYWSVPENLFAASNGTYIGCTEETRWGQPYRRYHWRETSPMVTYLVSISAAQYERLDDYFVYAPGETMNVTHYVFPEQVAAAVEDLSITVPALEFFSSILGLYPFADEKYGVAVCGMGGGMEHQTLTSCGSQWIRGDHAGDWIFVHELAHQWFGDLITCRDWSHIWLNEGFASYAEALWFEHVDGPERLRTYMEAQDLPWLWDGPVLREPGVYNPGYYFNSVVYDKAAWVLHMLRHVVGDDTFFGILWDYAHDPRYRYSTAATRDFIGVCEEHHGSSLGWFFDEWLTREDRLVYEWSWRSCRWSCMNSVTVTVDQLQDEPYTMPVDVRVKTAAGRVDTVFWIASRSEVHHVPLWSPVLDVELDPDGWILCDKSEAVTGVEPVPAVAFLDQNFPNPFNPETMIRFGVDRPSDVLMRIFDVRGALVATVVDGRYDTGVYTARWRGTTESGIPAASGLYLCRLRVGTRQFAVKMILLR